MNSSSTVTRVATHFAIGSVSEVTTGTISRFAGGMINTGDVCESLRQAFDPKSMLFDAALGGAVNSVQGILFIVFSKITFALASEFELEHRRANEDSRRQLFAKQLELLESIDYGFAKRRKKRIDEILRIYPFHDILN